MLHESTQKLILKLHELTLSGAVAWKEGEGDSVILETEGYQVELSHAPATMRLSRMGGRELERADEGELAETAWGDDRSFADVVSEMAREGSRYARGAEQAITRILKAAESGALAEGLDSGDEPEDQIEPIATSEDDIAETAPDTTEPSDDVDVEDTPSVLNDEAARLSAAVGDIAARINQSDATADEVEQPSAPEAPVAESVAEPTPEAVEPPSSEPAEAQDTTPDIVEDIAEEVAPELEPPAVEEAPQAEVAPKPQPLSAWPAFDNRPPAEQDNTLVEADSPHPADNEQTASPEADADADKVTFLSPEPLPLTEPLQTGEVVPPPPPFPMADNDAAPSAPDYPKLPDTPPVSDQAPQVAPEAEPAAPESKPFSWGAAKVTSLGVSIPRQGDQLVEGIPDDIETRASERSGETQPSSEQDDDESSDAPEGGSGGTIYKPWG